MHNRSFLARKTRTAETRINIDFLISDISRSLSLQEKNPGSETVSKSRDIDRIFNSPIIPKLSSRACDRAARCPGRY